MRAILRRPALAVLGGALLGATACDPVDVAVTSRDEPERVAAAEPTAVAEPAAREAVPEDPERVAARRAKREAEKAAALAILKRSSDFLGQQQRFSFAIEIGFDVLQTTGQRLEFGGSRKATVRRPDRARIEIRHRYGEEQTLFFDGTTISVDLPTENAYASIEKPGTLDETLAYLMDELGTPAPLGELLASDLYAEVVGGFESGFVVGDATLDGTRCQHVAFRGEALDLQLWVETGERPLPRRVVVTYKQAEGSPQFRARIHDWDLAPETPDELFAFAPPEGAERLPFAPRDVEENSAPEAPQ